MSYENCGSAHQIDELDTEFEYSADNLNRLLDQALSRKHAKHDYEDPMRNQYSRYNSHNLIRLHAADKSFNSYEGGSVAELTNVEGNREESDVPINTNFLSQQSSSLSLINRIENRDKRPQSDVPMNTLHENSKLSTNTKNHASSAKRLDVLEDQVQDGKSHHYVKEQYQNLRKTTAAQDDHGFSADYKNSQSDMNNQSHPFNNSLADSEKINEIMQMAYLKGKGGTEPSEIEHEGGVEFVSKEASMIDFSNKDLENSNSPKLTEEDDLEEYKHEEQHEYNNSNNRNANYLSNQLRELLVPISQADNESEDSESERVNLDGQRALGTIIEASEIDQSNDQENKVIVTEFTDDIENGNENIENVNLKKTPVKNATQNEGQGGSGGKGQRLPSEMSPQSAAESIVEFEAFRYSGISPRDMRGSRNSITKAYPLSAEREIVEGQCLSNREEYRELIENQSQRQVEEEKSDEEEEVENSKRSSKAQGKAVVESGLGLNRIETCVSEEEKANAGTEGDVSPNTENNQANKQGETLVAESSSNKINTQAQGIREEALELEGKQETENLKENGEVNEQNKSSVSEKSNKLGEKIAGESKEEKIETENKTEQNQTEKEAAGSLSNRVENKQENESQIEETKKSEASVVQNEENHQVVQKEDAIVEVEKNSERNQTEKSEQKKEEVVQIADSDAKPEVRNEEPEELPDLNDPGVQKVALAIQNVFLKKRLNKLSKAQPEAKKQEIEIKKEEPQAQNDDAEIKKEETEVKNEESEIKKEESQEELPDLNDAGVQKVTLAMQNVFLKKRLNKLNKPQPEVKKEESEVLKEQSEVKKEELQIKKEEPEVQNDESEIKKEEPKEELPDLNDAGVQKVTLAMQNIFLKKRLNKANKAQPEVKEEEPEVQKEQPEVKNEEPEIKKEEPKEELPDLNDAGVQKVTLAMQNVFLKKRLNKLNKAQPEVKKEETEVKNEESEIKNEESEIKKEPEIKKEEPKEELPDLNDAGVQKVTLAMQNVFLKKRLNKLNKPQPEVKKEELEEKSPDLNDLEVQKATTETVHKSEENENVSSVQKKEEGIIEGNKAHRKESIGEEEEAKQARDVVEDYNKSDKVSAKDIKSRQDISETEENATEATARNGENDADNITELGNQITPDMTHDMKSERLTSAVGSTKELDNVEEVILSQENQNIPHNEEVIVSIPAPEQQDSKKSAIDSRKESDGLETPNVNKEEIQAQQVESGEEVVDTEKKTSVVAAQENVSVKQNEQESTVHGEQENVDLQNNTQEISETTVEQAEKTNVKGNEQESNAAREEQSVDVQQSIQNNVQETENTEKVEADSETTLLEKEEAQVQEEESQKKTSEIAVKEEAQENKTQESHVAESIKESATLEQTTIADKEKAKNQTYKPQDQEVEHSQHEAPAHQENTGNIVTQPCQIKETDENQDFSNQENEHHQAVSSDNHSASHDNNTERSSEIISEVTKESAKNLGERLSHQQNSEDANNETRIDSTHNNTIISIVENLSKPSEINSTTHHNILDITTQIKKESEASEIKRSSNPATKISSQTHQSISSSDNARATLNQTEKAESQEVKTQTQQSEEEKSKENTNYQLSQVQKEQSSKDQDENTQSVKVQKSEEKSQTETEQSEVEPSQIQNQNTETNREFKNQESAEDQRNENLQSKKSQTEMRSPQNQEQPTQEVLSQYERTPNKVEEDQISTPIKSKRQAVAVEEEESKFALYLKQRSIQERGTQTEEKSTSNLTPAPTIDLQNVTHYRPLSSLKKKQRSTFRLFEKSVGEYEKDIDFMSKYTTKEVMQNLDHTPEQMEALFESAKKLYKITDDTPRGPPSDAELGGILNRVVIARSPVKEGKIDLSLIPIYQQVQEIYEDGTRYEGEMFLGKRHGTGTYYHKEGHKYVGNWEQGVMSGFGVLWLNEDQKWYEGEWANNVFHGRGSLYNTKPETLSEENSYVNNFDEIGNGWQKYEGQFQDGQRHRFGTILLTNGDVFVGNFRDNKAEGRGSYTRSNKKIIVGEWSENRLKRTF